MPTVTYQFSGSGVVGTVPPTAAQAVTTNSLSASVTFADADTTTLITHNWGLTTTQLSNLWPWANFYPAALGTATVAVGLSLALTNSVAVTLNKAATSAGTGVGSSIVVILQRPFSMNT